MKICKIKSPFKKSKYFENSILNVDCGEISMLADAGVVEIDGILYEHLGDICNLGTLNLVQYVDRDYYADESNKFKGDRQFGFDFELFKSDTALLVRALDNLIDESGYPLPELKTAAMLRRKIGAGIMGYGSALMMMGIRYGSKAALCFTEKLMEVFVNESYLTSSALASEKGSYLLWDGSKAFNGGYLANGFLSEQTLQHIKVHGLRNSQVLTAAPNGNLSIYAGCISGGIEPVFEREYVRWVTQNHNCKRLLGDKPFPDYERGAWHETDYFKYETRGAEQILVSTDGEFMIDKSRGLTQKVAIEDLGWKHTKAIYGDRIGQMEKDGLFATAMELVAEEHIEPFILLSKYVDNSISKCMRLDNTMVIIDNKIVYLDELDYGDVDEFVPYLAKTKDHTGQKVNIVETYNNGKSEIIRVTFSDDSFIDCTPNHKIFTNDGWQRSADIKLQTEI